MRRQIRLTEGQLRNVVEEVSRRVIQEVGALVAKNMRNQRGGNYTKGDMAGFAAGQTAYNTMAPFNSLRDVADNMARGATSARNHMKTAIGRDVSRGIMGSMGNMAGASANGARDAVYQTRAGLRGRKPTH